jgi:predicted Zn-dependent peptidase
MNLETTMSAQRSSRRRIAAPAAILALLFNAGAATAAEDARAGLPKIPIETFTLPNGLNIVLSEDHAFPVVAYSLTYGVGSRAEIEGRSGFAHLFEHMMYQGSANVAKGEYFKHVESNGGVFNGQTHVDYTNYYAELPAHKLELALWLEADRMRSLAITAENLANQQEAVKEEKRLGLDNQPYASALVVSLYETAFTRHANRHSVIGSFDDLNAASVEDVAAFFKTYYAPNNAVLTLVGDFERAEARSLVEKHFGGIPSQPRPPAVETSEPPSTAEKRITVQDAHAPSPGLVVGWRGPDRGSRDYYALGILEPILYDGASSRLYQSLVKGKEVAVAIQGSMGFPLGTYADYRSPALMALFVIYKPSVDASALTGLVQEEVDRIAKNGVPADEIARAKVKFRSTVFRGLTGTLERAISLGTYARLDGDPRRLTEDLARFLDVTPAEIREAASRFLTTSNRIVVDIQPASGSPSREGSQGGQP